MKQIITSVFFDILSFTIGITIFSTFWNLELNLIKIGRLLHIAFKKSGQDIKK